LWDRIGAKFRVIEFDFFFAIYVCVYVEVKVKVKFTLEQATKAQRGSRSIALLFL